MHAAQQDTARDSAGRAGACHATALRWGVLMRGCDHPAPAGCVVWRSMGVVARLFSGVCAGRYTPHACLRAARPEAVVGRAVCPGEDADAVLLPLPELAVVAVACAEQCTPI